VVVNLAVKDEPRLIVAAMHRLVTGGREVDDREPAKPEAATAIVEEEFAGVVGAAMRHLIAHAHEQRGLDRSLTRTVFPNSADSAH